MLNGKRNGEVVALGFTAGFIGAAAVLLTATLMFYTGISPALGVASPLSLAPPGVYRPLVWGGFWGIPLGFILRWLKGHHKAVGFIRAPRGPVCRIHADGRNGTFRAQGRAGAYGECLHR
jgi:hypothetical protein